jgi:hypothetical protein
MLRYELVFHRISLFLKHVDFNIPMRITDRETTVRQQESKSRAIEKNSMFSNRFS